MTTGAWDIPARETSHQHRHSRTLSASSPKWADASAPLTSPRSRKLSVFDVATSPMAVNFHTWRVNALTTNAYRQSLFLEHAQKALNHQAPAGFVKKALRILKDLELPAPPSHSPVGYGSLRSLLLAPTAHLSDAEWLIAIKTLLAPFPELIDEFKEAFGVREDETPQIDESASLADLPSDKPLVRRSSSKVQFDHPPTPGTDAHSSGNTYFPPTPAPLDTHVLPFEFDNTNSPMPMSPAVASASDADPATAIKSAEPEPNEVCLNGHYIAYDLHVAMMDRPNEMRDLVARNPEIFENVQHCCPTDEAWLELEDIFYVSRDEMDDLTWMKEIGARMESNPSLLAMLKELVGYDMHEEVLDAAEDSDSDESFEGDVEEPSEQRLEWLDKVVKMRDMPEIMARLENDYPQFFANVRKALTEEDETDYEHFMTAFFSSAGQLSDEEWEREIQRYLSRSKQLLGQLREIALYELDIDEEKVEPEQDLFEPVSADLVPPGHTSSVESRIEVKSRADLNTMRELETDHPLFFNLLRKHLNTRDDYHRFLRALYAPRESIADDKWEALITRRFLSTSRRLRQMFREVVDATVISTSEIMDSDDEDYLGRFEVPVRGLPDASQRLLRLQVAQPEVFGKIKRKLGDQYGRFTALMVTGRDELDDDHWAERIEAFLESDLTLTTEFARITGAQQLKKMPDAASGKTRDAGGAPSHIALPATIPTISYPGAGVTATNPASPTPSEASVQFAVREQLPSSVPQLEFYLDLKTAVDDDKIYGKLLHALIEREETEKIVAREREEGVVAASAAAAAGASPSLPTSFPLHGSAAQQASSTASNDQHISDMHAVLDVLHDVAGPSSDVTKRVESWIASRG
ncbi:hypothetical protein PhCBS80983_g00601 [Powellomyces hirtus]|uniref:Uncharacterized protein n=1 Tax=Powellomyces hirtus TaxID=109895 RepID=A0A507EDD3_9FUNG|nr:hypothetical protein PhCBS80983_g00601 [Powellomyces hirtus]